MSFDIQKNPLQGSLLKRIIFFYSGLIQGVPFFQIRLCRMTKKHGVPEGSGGSRVVYSVVVERALQCEIYADDLGVYGRTEEECQSEIRALHHRLPSRDIKVSTEELHFLGMRIPFKKQKRPCNNLFFYFQIHLRVPCRSKSHTFSFPETIVLHLLIFRAFPSTHFDQWNGNSVEDN